MLQLKNYSLWLSKYVNLSPNNENKVMTSLWCYSKMYSVVHKLSGV
jgi:hypothetical protein